MGTSVTLVIRPKYPGEFDDLGAFLPEFEQELPSDVAVRVLTATPQAGFGVTWHEILQIWVIGTGGVAGTAFIASAAGRAGQLAVDLIAAWIQRQQRSSKRPRTVELRGADGRIISSVTIKDSTRMDDTESKSRDNLSVVPPPKGW